MGGCGDEKTWYREALTITGVVCTPLLSPFMWDSYDCIRTVALSVAHLCFSRSCLQSTPPECRRQNNSSAIGKKLQSLLTATMASSFKWVAACSILLLLAPLFSSQTVQSIADNAATGRTGVILLLSKTYSGRDDRANCDVQVNTSHASSGLVTISGADQSTTIDCSGTGLRCFSVTDVSVIIKFVK